MLEPVLGEGGVLPLDDAFVDAAAEIAREVGALLVLDEVQTGLGRTGTFFAFEQLGIEPDLVTLAKGLGNGLPIGALLVREGVARGDRAGRPRIDVRRQPRRVRRGVRRGRGDRRAAARRTSRRGGAARGRARRARRESARCAAAGSCWRRARPRRRRGGRRGARARAARPHGGPNVLRLLPPLVVTEPEVDEALELLGRVLG